MVLEGWCHCDFRKMEALKVNKFGRTYCTEHKQLKLSLWEVTIIFLNLYVFHYANHYSRFAIQHMEVLALRSVIFITKYQNFGLNIY